MLMKMIIRKMLLIKKNVKKIKASTSYSLEIVVD